MPSFAVSPLVGRPDWVSSAEQRLFAFLKTGHPSPVPSTQPMCTSKHRQEVKVRKPLASSKTAVAIVAPGAGTGINGAVYSELGRHPNFKVEVVGQSRAPYDVYPPCWQQGTPAPNLQSFADEVLDMGVHKEVEALIFGSRGGQVVLPHMWQAEVQGHIASVPPAVVINGGCAMNLPAPVSWPENAVTFLLIGGNDFFRGGLSMEEYVAETRSYVPFANKSTAILCVNEMNHMPQQGLLRGVLRVMLRAITSWKADKTVPVEHFRKILAFLKQDGWSGRLLYTTSAGSWEDIPFSSAVEKQQAKKVTIPIHQTPTPMSNLSRELSSKDAAKVHGKSPPNKVTRLAQVVKVF